MLPQVAARQHGEKAAKLGLGLAARMMGHSVQMFTETYADLLIEATADMAERAGRFLAQKESAMAGKMPTGDVVSLGSGKRRSKRSR